MTTSAPGIRESYSDDALRDVSRRFNRIILWGLTPPTSHTHFHIYYAYFRVCKILGLNVHWVQESEENVRAIQRNDVVFIHGSTNNMILEVMNQGPTIIDFHVDQNRGRLGGLLELVASYPRRVTERERHEQDAMFLDPITSYSPSMQILSQPWGTDLLPSEFSTPADSHWSDKLYWVGSWWKNEGWGNYDEILTLKEHSEIAGLKFVQLSNCATGQNRFFVRRSRIAPSIGGAGQVRSDYLACRFFKNISYGQFCISNVSKSKELLAGTAVYDSSVSKAVERGLEISPKSARELVLFQQHCIRNYTVAAHLYLIFRAATEFIQQ